jgi:hypothetical protein
VNTLPTLRIARPVRDLDRAEAMYVAGLDLARLSRFGGPGHAGFAGSILGWRGAPWHLEFTVCADHPVAPVSTAEDLLVLYIEDEVEWTTRCAAMRDAGFCEVEPFNPWWSERGHTFVCADGYRTVLRHGGWPSRATAPAMAPAAA